MISVTVRPTQASTRVRDSLGRFMKYSQVAYTNSMRDMMEDLEDQVEKNLSGEVLNVWTGDLKKKIRFRLSGTGKEIAIEGDFSKAPHGFYHEKYNAETTITIRPITAERLFIPLKPSARPGKRWMRFGEDYVLTKGPVRVKRAPFIKPAAEAILKKTTKYERHFEDAWEKAFGT